MQTLLACAFLFAAMPSPSQPGQEPSVTNSAADENIEQTSTVSTPVEPINVEESTDSVSTAARKPSKKSRELVVITGAEFVPIEELLPANDINELPPTSAGDTCHNRGSDCATSNPTSIHH